MRFIPGLILVLLAARVSAEPLQLPSDLGAIAVTTSIAGDDLSIVAESDEPVKNHLNADDPIFSIDLFFDTDNKVETGSQQVTDARRGAEYSVMVILRATENGGVQGKPQEVLLVKEGEVGTFVNTNTRLRVDGAKIQVFIPLAAMGLRKGQTIRVAGYSGPNDPRDQTIKLLPPEPAASPRKRE